MAGTHDNGVEMEGTLEYISPEQTGRMNRVVDYRSDFYSLGMSSNFISIISPSSSLSQYSTHTPSGVTFYELLTGIPPFTQSGPQAYIDLVYKHLAVHPRSILEVLSTSTHSSRDIALSSLYPASHREIIFGDELMMYLDQARSWICTVGRSC